MHFFIALLLPILGVAIVNFVVDPFCFFGPSNNLVTRKFLFDERTQKTNYVMHSTGQYDGLLLGSSRTAFVDPTTFTSGTFFNYAASGMLPREYEGFIQLFRKWNTIKTVVIGFDFFATNVNQGAYNPKQAHFYESQASYRDLLNYKGLHYSRVSFSCSIRGETCDERSYTQVFTRTWNRWVPSERARRLEIQLKQYATTYYGSNFEFDNSLQENLRQLRYKNPGIKFIAFTTPDSAELFKLMIDQGLSSEYVRWIETLYQHFDEVYDFMGVSSVTSNEVNYLDAHHFSPRVGDWIVRRIEGSATGIPPNFGVKITREELENYRRLFAIKVRTNNNS